MMKYQLQKMQKKKGLEQGIELGIEQGLEQGEKRKSIEVARKLLIAGIDIRTIRESTGLSEDEIRKIK